MSQDKPAGGPPSRDAERRKLPFTELVDWIVTHLGYSHILKEGGISRATLDRYLSGHVPKRQRQELIDFHFWVKKSLPERYPPKFAPPEGLLALSGASRQQLAANPDNDAAPTADPTEAEAAASAEVAGASKSAEAAALELTSTPVTEADEQETHAPPSSSQPLVPETATPAVDSQGESERPTRRPARLWWLLSVVIVVVALIFVALRSGKPDTPTPAPTPTPTTAATLTFNSLGGGSAYVRVFSDVTDPNSTNGTFKNGQKALVVCWMQGRRVPSVPSDGEERRSSDTWVHIEQNVPMYAPLTYGDLDRDISAVPHC